MYAIMFWSADWKQMETVNKKEGGVKAMDKDYFKRRLVEAWIHVWEIVLALVLFKILSG